MSNGYATMPNTVISLRDEHDYGDGEEDNDDLSQVVIDVSDSVAGVVRELLSMCHTDVYGAGVKYIYTLFLMEYLEIFILTPNTPLAYASMEAHRIIAKHTHGVNIDIVSECLHSNIHHIYDKLLKVSIRVNSNFTGSTIVDIGWDMRGRTHGYETDSGDMGVFKCHILVRDDTGTTQWN